MKVSKRLLSLLLSFIMLLSGVSVAFAVEEITVGNYTYTVLGDNATIVSCSEKATGNLNIPSTLGGKTVTAIGDGAFQACTVVTGIIIPSTVKTIGKNAFAFCFSLTKIEIPSSVTYIGNNAFRNSNKAVIYCQSGSYAHKYAQDNGIEFELAKINKAFDENTYIADIWLSQNRTSKTTENRYIDEFLSYTSLSSDVYLSLRNDAAFMSSVEIWEALEVVFDPAKQVKQVYNEKTIYESLIMDLLEKVSKAKSREVNNAILNAVDTVGKVSDTVTKYKGIVDAVADLASGSSETLLEILKTWKFDPKNCSSFQQFYATLNNISDTVDDKWSDQSFIQGIGTIAEIGGDVATFFKRFTGYIYVSDMADEMVVMLEKMRDNTASGFFRTALNDVIRAFKNVNYASLILTCDLGANIAIDVADALFNKASKAIPGYNVLRSSYKVVKGFMDLVFSTSNIIDKFYLVQASYNFINAGRAAIESLKKDYLSSGSSVDAGAYIYAVRSFRYVYEIDIESAIDFVKVAETEGIANKIELGVKSVWNFITGKKEKTSYEKMKESKETILSCIDSQLYWLACSWKFKYLESDYPEIYPLFLYEEISQDMYKPQISSCYIEKSGKTNLEWSMPSYFYDREGNIYPLYADIHGIVASETVAGQKKEVNYSEIFDAPNPLQFYNGTYFNTFNKKYRIKGYSTTVSAGNVYTNETEQVLAYPLVTPQVEIALDRDTVSATKKGLPIKITDYSKSEYSFMKYDIYRKINDSKWVHIGTINRSPKFGTHSTVYYDERAKAGYAYSYKVISSLKFDNGVTLRSSESNVFSTNDLSEKSVRKDLFIERSFTKNTGIRTKSLMRAAVAKEIDTMQNILGIKISWEEVSGATQYEIYRLASFGNVFKKIGEVDGKNLSYIDTDITNGCEYTYRVIPCTKKDGTKQYDLNTYAEGAFSYAVEHVDDNNDGECDRCGRKISEPASSDPSSTCSHLCHKTGFMGFIYKIIRIFWKLFRIHQTCECGVKHY